MTLLEKAQKKFYNKKNTIDYSHGNFKDFILECYLNMEPATYGKHIQNMFQIIANKQDYVELFRLSESEDRGDLKLQYPIDLDFVHKHTSGLHYFLECTENMKKNRFDFNWEFKVSFLGKAGNYTIRNVKPHQQLKGGYIFCLIDCENDFKEEFYVLSKEDFFQNFKFSHMNGTNKENKKGEFQNLGTSIQKGSFNHKYLKRLSQLDGTSMNDLFVYFKKKHYELREQFYQTKEYKDYIENKTNKLVEFNLQFTLPSKSEKDNFKKNIKNVMDNIGPKYDRLVGYDIDYESFKIILKIKGVFESDECREEIHIELLKFIGKRSNIISNILW